MSIYRHRTRAQMLEWLTTNVRHEDECHIWAGACNSDGYPVVCWHQREVRCHARSLLLELRGKKMPERPVTWSTCGRRTCMNPEHLLSGTRADMTRWLAQQGRYPTGPRRSLASASGRIAGARMGVAHARTVASLAAQGVSHKEIGERYGVVPSTVGHALKRWRRTGLIV